MSTGAPVSIPGMAVPSSLGVIGTSLGVDDSLVSGAAAMASLDASSASGPGVDVAIDSLGLLSLVAIMLSTALVTAAASAAGTDASVAESLDIIGVSAGASGAASAIGWLLSVSVGITSGVDIPIGVLASAGVLVLLAGASLAVGDIMLLSAD